MTGPLKTRIDVPLLIIALLLGITLFLFFYGIFPYPFGFIILSLLFVGRLLMLKDKNRVD